MQSYVNYAPFEQRTIDTQYKDLLRLIKNEGIWYQNQMEEPALTYFGAQLRFKLRNGAPIIVERDLASAGKSGRSYLGQALSEIIGFICGAHTQEQLSSYGCSWWDSWLTERKCSKRGLETGDMGPGSYGAAWTNFPTADGLGFNQITALVDQIKANPQLRTHLITPWVPQYIFRAPGYQQKVVVVPCHGWINIRINIETGSFVLIHHQRSADVPVGLPANLAGYTAFALMLAKVTGYTAEELIFSIDDAHIYKRQLAAVETILSTGDEKLPSLLLESNARKMTDFRASDFNIKDYHPTGKRFIIPTPV